MENYSTFVSVLIDLAVDKPLEYAVPQEFTQKIKRGMLVQVPLRGVIQQGYILEIKKKSIYPKVLPLHGFTSEEALISEELFELAAWMSQYYNAPLRQVFKSILPASVRKHGSHKELFFVKRALSKENLRKYCLSLREKHPSQAKVLDVLLLAKDGMLLSELLEKAETSKSPIESLEKSGLITMQKMRIDRSPLINEEYFKTQPKTLNPDQQLAYERVTCAISEQRFETHLLYGVTGSGKTEVYLQAIEFALRRNLSTLMLVPEISLTGQTIERFRSRFDDSIAILHHRLSQGERYDEWHRIRRGEAKIVIGARSALFSPIQNLGLIIVDEEHDGAYKQNEESPCYHARDVAVMRGKLNQAVVVLGTATPSMESYFNSQIGKYTLTKLSSRATSSLPTVKIVDMKKEHEKAGGFTNFSEILIEKMKLRIENGEQIILFLNRRGYHTSLQCKDCGYIFKCPFCETTLTFHRKEEILTCHLCGFKQIFSFSVCPQCKHGEALKYKGVGTEQIERGVHALFPEARTLRIDSDTTRHKGSHERLFRAFSTQKADVLIGTQMVTKGLHFPAVTLVAVLNSDGGLHIPDFRASERVFQLITQVAGRAGRGELKGEVIIQTNLPENSTINQAAAQNFEAFYESEDATRKMFNFPPYTHFIKLTFSGADAHITQAWAENFRFSLTQLLTQHYLIHPVVPSGYPKIKELYRFQCLIRGKNVYPANAAIKKVLGSSPLPRTIKIQVDVDPLSTYF